MIQQQTLLKVFDNSGAKLVKCIKILGGLKKKYATIGDMITVSVQKLRNRSKKTAKVKKKEVYRALVIRTKRKTYKKNGFNIIFNENATILVNKQGNPIATRILGSISKELKQKKLQKFVSISTGLI